MPLTEMPNWVKQIWRGWMQSFVYVCVYIYISLKPVNPKGTQSSTFLGRTDAEAKAPILSPPNVKNWLTRKDPDAGKDWGQKEKEVTEDEMITWHHWLNGHEFEQTPGNWWRTGKPGMLQSMGSQNVRHNLATEQQHVYVCIWIYMLYMCVYIYVYVSIYTHAYLHRHS